ncbi:glycosyltransferase family 1 protein [cyanobiont of Ornithocercus magnificus]|nr:glycosyltransferase family 1 protein [cyanobiont of Ornithocercus magnificus]
MIGVLFLVASKLAIALKKGFLVILVSEIKDYTHCVHNEQDENEIWKHSIVNNQSKRPCVRLLCLPDVEYIVGGVKQIYRHAEHLVTLGWDAAVVTESTGFRPSWFTSTAPTISLLECISSGDLEPNHCILVLPETYIGVDLTDIHGFDFSKIARVVFNQNAYYSYGLINTQTATNLHYFYDDPSVLQVLSISENTHAFLAENLALEDHRLSRIVNAVEPYFCANQPKINRMHWMPRKNSGHAQAVFQGLHRRGVKYGSGWEAVPLEGVSHYEVANQLSNARLFLSFSHPEGFGLPIAEAMASGCWVVGYSGLGGHELFRFGASEEVVFGDWLGFVVAIQRAFQLFAEQPRETRFRLERQALALRTLHSSNQEQQSVSKAWDRIEVSFQAWRRTFLNL